MAIASKKPRQAYRTDLGVAYQGDSRRLLSAGIVDAGSVDLIFTSPPFALTRPKDYGNESTESYWEWFETFVDDWLEMLAPTGSLVIDVGGAYLPGAPKRSTYHFELAVRLARRLDLCQEFYWYNPAKLPAPAQWTNVLRSRVKDSVNLLLWFSKDASRAKADNRRVLRRYSDSMRALLKSGYQTRMRPSNHQISDGFLRQNGGSIPSNLVGFANETEQTELAGEPFETAFDNLVAISNTASTDRYLAACRKNSIKPHNARFPVGLPSFFIEFLSEPGDLVLDPFAGSNTTGEAAEALGRRWLSCEIDSEGEFAGTYVRASAFRFPHAKLTQAFSEMPTKVWKSAAKRVTPASR